MDKAKWVYLGAAVGESNDIAEDHNCDTSQNQLSISEIFSPKLLRQQQVGKCHNTWRERIIITVQKYLVQKGLKSSRKNLVCVIIEGKKGDVLFLYLSVSEIFGPEGFKQQQHVGKYHIEGEKVIMAVPVPECQ